MGMNFSYFFEMTFGRQSKTVERFTIPERATYAPRATIDAIWRLPILFRRYLEDANVDPGHLPFLHQGTVDDEVAARREHGEEFFHRGTVHYQKPLGAPDYGGADLLVGDDHRAVRGAAPHLHPVRGEVGDVLLLLHRREGQQVPDHQDPLPSEPGHDDVARHAKSACSRSLFYSSRFLTT